MTKDEYVESFVFGKDLVNVGLDDSGQCYFLECAFNGELKQISCGSYNSNYKEVAEYWFGAPERDCPYYKDRTLSMGNCYHNKDFGFCSNCKFEDVNEHRFQTLVYFGVLDRRGNITEAYSDILKKKEDPINENE